MESPVVQCHLGNRPFMLAPPVLGTIEEAERETEDGQVIYEVEVEDSDGTEYEVEVTADGKIHRVRSHEFEKMKCSWDTDRIAIAVGVPNGERPTHQVMDIVDPDWHVTVDLDGPAGKWTFDGEGATEDIAIAWNMGPTNYAGPDTTAKVTIDYSCTIDCTRHGPVPASGSVTKTFQH